MKTILVDYDGTLHDSDSKFIAEFSLPARELGLRGKKLWEIYLFDVHRGIVNERFPEKHNDPEFHSKLIFKQLKRPYDPQIAEKIIEGFKRALEECWTNPSFFDDTFEFLNRVVEENKLCLATFEYAKEKAECVERFGRRKYFDSVLGDYIINHRKTDKEYYEEALKISNSTPEETVIIGDTLTHDIVPAKLVGIKTIWLNRRNERAPENSKPDHEVKKLTEVLNYL